MKNSMADNEGLKKNMSFKEEDFAKRKFNKVNSQAILHCKRPNLTLKRYYNPSTSERETKFSNFSKSSTKCLLKNINEKFM